jgi:siroheme synthase-like protein
VVGGGPVAARKASGLLDCGAVVTVVAPDVCDDMARLAPLTVARRPYVAGEAAGYRLVVTATGIAAIDGAVYADAEAAGVWVNSADDPDHCTVVLPAVTRDGPVTVAVSTGGSSPALASWLRSRIADILGPGLGPLASLLDDARRRVHARGASTETVDWSGLLDGPLPDLVRDGKLDQARLLIDSAVDAALDSAVGSDPPVSSEPG